MTISKEVLLNRYADCLSDMFPKRRIRDSSFPGYVFVDDSIANRLRGMLEKVSKILEKFFPQDIDVRSLKYVGTLIENFCIENCIDFLPQEKISLSYQQFLQTLGSVQYFSLDFFPSPTQLDLSITKYQYLFSRQRHLPIGVVIALKDGQEIRQFRVFSWKLNFKQNLDKNGSLIQPYLRRQLSVCNRNEMSDQEPAVSVFIWEMYKKTFTCIEEILVKEDVEFFLLQGVGVDFQIFLKEKIKKGDLRKIYDVCFFKNGLCFQILLYKKVPTIRLHAMQYSKPEDKSKRAHDLISSSAQISEIQMFLGSWFFLNVDIDDLDFNETAKGTRDLVENIKTILKEQVGNLVFFLIGGSIKSAENIEKIFQENQSLQVVRLKSSYFTDVRFFFSESFLKKRFSDSDEFTLIFQRKNDRGTLSVGVDSLDMEKVIEIVKDHGLGFSKPASELIKTSVLINI